jgi:hypothetical protein
MIKCKDCKHLKETELGGQTYYECLKIWNVEIHDKNFEHLCNQYETKVNDVDTSHDKALNLAVVMAMLPTNEEIQFHIEKHTRHNNGEVAMDEQAFYEGAKWLKAELFNLKAGNKN